MSDLLAWLRLGMSHILDPRGLDHVLFIAALAAIYRLRDWRRVAWVVTSFTLGHSITLALAVTGLLVLPSAAIEFLIPVTIVATCVENLYHARRPDVAPRAWGRPVLAGVFGLVHGAGFANYLRALFVDDLAVPLLGFNLGLELGQVVALVTIALVMAGLDRVLARDPLRGATRRTIAVSGVVGIVAAYWAVERAPW